jgi:NADPH:quinone reductase-like Zn-dependent oxidoreductase
MSITELPPTMKAWRLHGFDGTESMGLDEIARPTPGDAEVLVRVRTAAANPVDWYMADGLLTKFKINLPSTMGRDAAGVVVAIGKDVVDFRVGDSVYGQADPEHDGTFAEYVRLRTDRLMRKPQALNFAEAAALPNAIYPAWNALFSTDTGANLQPGQTVLIHGAGGGIGTLLVQLAKRHGARVIAVASTSQETLVRALGADEYVDYQKQKFEVVVGEHVDAVVDTISAAPEDKSHSILKRGGIYVSLRKEPDRKSAQESGVRAALAFGPNSYADTREIEALLLTGKVRPIVKKIVPFTEAPAALNELRTGHATGKIVIQVESEK